MAKSSLQGIANNLRDKFQFSTEADKQWVIDQLTRSVAINDDDVSPLEATAVTALLMSILPKAMQLDLANRLCDNACG